MRSGSVDLGLLDQTSCAQQRSDIQKARDGGSVNVAALSEYLHGGKEKLNTYLRMAKLVNSNPVFSRHKRYHLSRAEVSLHFEMFMPVLKAQASDEQYAKWGKAAENFEIIGCYAQTEIGHGSNLSGLETTATFEKTSEGGQFILNSPTLSSLKWWIGGLGVICTHALVQAKLVINGRDHGPHLFIVQIRSLKDHTPMPGIEVGDIGAKFGMTKNDNGWVKFTNARIPRSQLLSRFSSVSEDGEYIPPVHPKISYGGMVLVRAELVERSWLYLSRAVTIATRYTTVRRQFTLNSSSQQENAVISYPLVKFRLFPLIAACFVFNSTGTRMADLFQKMTKELMSYKAELLPFVHAISAGLKSYCTSFTADAIEESRKICHGFSKYSGFFHLYTEYVATNTYEGDNALLTQQLARFLLKALDYPTHPLEWLDEKNFSMAQSHHLVNGLFSNLSADLLPAFRHRVKRLVGELALAVKAGGFDSQNVLAFRVSVAFSQYFCLESISNVVQAVPILSLLRDVYAHSTLITYAADWLEDQSIDGAILKKYRLVLENDLLEKMAPEVVRLTDSLMVPDFLLDSAIGAYDGNAYFGLLNSALRDPVNTEVNATNTAYLKYIRPIFHDGQASSKL